eukprot:Gregarina_sp_Poly_1__1361@NODE_1338_length_4352_cov_80_604901_g899_i0_p2_GENE_NODE_1338_length_4352_cov_80_604901_g899_i0NODE_1338_length_4352_cov_80_604901_g899_i0_p2_ORF_typecomplete_len540_score62_39ANAPC4_WD40/PF12894_7/0_018ANAPC4_WD40/PF12894_7/3_9e02ANAPC4_WD40/PF12894_7/0_32ANAPC4_WD40/PF12894_7/0_19ANAPC4_WD40/PF12894_7/0_074ANAPC4_WD40/PF12894_7/0_026WD40/PF00400_32/3_1e02WD40/PF00400_32/4_4WD40/PF00400_32/0_00054WD40/PF00400_32/2e03WD40/PF00400_32/0_44Frtz/PF11768_8/35Frtz/PF11768_8/6
MTRKTTVLGILLEYQNLSHMQIDNGRPRQPRSPLLSSSVDSRVLFLDNSFIHHYLHRNYCDRRFENYINAPFIQTERWTSNGPFENCLTSAPRIPLTTFLAKRVLLRGKSGQPRCLTWKSEGDRLLCGLASGEVATYSATTLECDDLKRILAATGEITAMTALRRSDILLFGDSSGKLHFSSKNFAPLKLVSVYNQANAVFALEPNAIDSNVVVGVKAANPLLLDVTKHETVGVFVGLGFETSCLSYHPRQPLIAAGSRTAQLQLWDPRVTLSSAQGGSSSSAPKHSTHVAAAFAHRSSITDIKWHPSRDFHFLTCAKDQLVYLWDLRRPRTAGDSTWNPIKVWKLDQPLREPAYHDTEPLELSHLNARSADNDGCKCCMTTTVMPTKKPVEFFPTESIRFYPLCVDWHPWAADVFAVGHSNGFISIFQGDDCCARVDQSKTQTNWHQASGGVDCLTWHSNGSLLVSTCGPTSGYNGAVLFWLMPPKYAPLCDTNWCGDASHTAKPTPIVLPITAATRRRRSSLILNPDAVFASLDNEG